MSKLLLASALILAATKLQAQAPAPQVFGPVHISDEIDLPDFPSSDDWALSLLYAAPGYNSVRE
jgi:hypothetical protein